MSELTRTELPPWRAGGPRNVVVVAVAMAEVVTTAVICRTLTLPTATPRYDAHAVL